jgi:hypothetical protein
MCQRPQRLERFIVGFELHEAQDALLAILAELQDGEYQTLADMGGLRVTLAHVLDHLCRSWHGRNLAVTEWADQSQEAFDAMSSTVPNWEGRFQLIDGATTHDQIAPLLRRRLRLSVPTIEMYLRATESALHALVTALAADELDYVSTEQLASRFTPILQSICLAWHLAFLTLEEVSSLASTTINEISSWVPQLNWNARLVPQGADPLKTNRRMSDADGFAADDSIG